jgi:hypothetical protein
VALTRYNFDTPLELPSTPQIGEKHLREEFQRVYDAIFLLAYKINSGVTLAVRGQSLVLIDDQATPHYWRVTVSAAGALVTTDLGTTPPTP